MPNLPESLVERLKSRQAVLVTGLGCAEVAGLPGWPALCERMAEWIEDEPAKQAFLAMVSHGRLANAAALLRDLVAVDALSEVLIDAYPAAHEVPETISSVVRAPWRGIITTGYDTLWATALAQAGEKPERIVGATGAAALEPGRGRFLVQLFGRTDVPDLLCLAPVELGPKIVATGASELVLGLHRKWSFVFVGYGTDAPDLAMLAGHLLGASNSTVDHYLLCPGLSDFDARRARAQFGLVPIAFDGSLQEGLQALGEACNLAGDKPPADHVEAWLERLTAEPEDEEALEMLEQGLATLCENKEWERLVGALIGKVELEPDPKEQAADLYEAGLILDKELGAADRAYAVLMMALRLDPHDTALLADTKRIAEKAGQSKEFHDELAQLEQEAQSSPEAEQMALGVARMLAEDVNRREDAIAAFQKLLDRNPANAEAFAGLEALLRKAERWDALQALLTKAVQRDPNNAEMTAKLEELFERTKQNTPLVQLLTDKLARDPQDTAAFTKLEQVFERTKQNTPLVELLSDRLARDPEDMAALTKLEGAYKKKKEWKELVALYEKLLLRNPDDAEIWGKLAGILQQTEQWQRLGTLYEARLAKDSGDAALVGKAEELYRGTEQWQPLADLLERRAAQKTVEEARPLRLERATILLDKCHNTEAAVAVGRGFLPDDAAAAEEVYAKCIERDSSSPAPLLAMADLAKSKGDHLRAAKFLLDAAGRTQNPLELGRLFAEAGSIHLTELGDEDRAIECFAGALAADPEQSTAVPKLLDLWEKREEWAKAEPLFELLLRKTDEGAAKSELLRRQATCARKLGKLDKAVAALGAAAELDKGSYALARELGDLHFARDAFAEARAAYERAKDLLGADVEPQTRVGLYQQLALCALKTDDKDAALQSYEEALALAPEQRDLLRAVLELREAREEWSKVVGLYRRLLALAESDEERVKLHEQIGDIQQEKQNDWEGAMASYDEALVLEPDRRQVLYKTLDHYTAEKQWPEAVAALEQLATLASPGTERAKLCYTVAAIYRDEMKDTTRAVEQFGKVLDEDPLHPKAFEASEKLLTEAKNWRELERVYRQQLKRLPQDAAADAKLRLWDSLCDVELKLHDRESATAAMEAALAIDTDNIARHERLARTYFEMGPTKADQAIAHHQYLVAHQPDRLESYKALAALFYQTGAHDKMWCVAGAMTYLGKADPPLRALFENYRPTQTPSAAGRLTGELWRKVVHHDENPYLDALFALLAPAIAMTTAQPAKALGLDKHARVDTATDVWPYSAVLRYVANTIESTVPDVYVKRDLPGTVMPANLRDKNTLLPSLVVGLGFGQLASHSEAIFDLAKRMMLLRAERLPRLALATGSALDIAARAGLLLGGAPIGPGEHGQEVEKMAKHLDGLLTTPVRAELKVVAKRYVEACGPAVDIGTWIIASDLTASRAALVLCGDIVAASRVLSLEPTGLSPLPVAERMNDLLSYFVSEDHFAVRAALGMQVYLTPPAEPSGSRPRRMSHMQIKVPPGQ